MDSPLAGWRSRRERAGGTARDGRILRAGRPDGRRSVGWEETRRAMAKWHEEVYKLPKDLKWNVRPGYKTFVAERGAVRFDIPQDWVMIPQDTSIKFQDHESP